MNAGPAAARAEGCFRCYDVSADDAIPIFMSVHRSRIRLMIDAIAGDDPYMRSELRGAAMTALWTHDASRWDDADASQLLGVVRSAMLTARKEERRSRSRLTD